MGGVGKNTLAVQTGSNGRAFPDNTFDLFDRSYRSKADSLIQRRGNVVMKPRQYAEIDLLGGGRGGGKRKNESANVEGATHSSCRPSCALSSCTSATPFSDPPYQCHRPRILSGGRKSMISFLKREFFALKRQVSDKVDPDGCSNISQLAEESCLTAQSPTAEAQTVCRGLLHLRDAITVTRGRRCYGY
jgi:hypothetical protein